MTGPGRARRLLERLGPNFVKLGQHMALCPDLVGPEFCDEFLKLTDRAPALPFEEVRRIISEDLRGEPEEFYSWINPCPLASRSLAQTHEARTLEGEPVVIKIQRPDARQVIARDMGRARVIEHILAIAQADVGVLGNR